MNKATIAVFGDLLYDCFIWSDRLPRVGETVTGYASGFFASGKGGNQAAVCAKLGAEVYMLGKVGTDERGDFLLETMRGANVNVDGEVVSVKDGAMLCVAGKTDSRGHFVSLE